MIRRAWSYRLKVARVMLPVSLIACALHLVAFVAGDQVAWGVFAINADLAAWSGFVIGSDVLWRHATAHGWKPAQWVRALALSATIAYSGRVRDAVRPRPRRAGR